MLLSTERCSEQLIGGAKTEIEVALKRLEQLTEEEAQMGIAQNLKATATVGQTLRAVEDRGGAIEKTVAGVDDRMASLDGKMEVVNDKVEQAIRGA